MTSTARATSDPLSLLERHRSSHRSTIAVTAVVNRKQVYEQRERERKGGREMGQGQRPDVYSQQDALDPLTPSYCAAPTHSAKWLSWNSHPSRIDDTIL